MLKMRNPAITIIAADKTKNHFLIRKTDKASYIYKLVNPINVQQLFKP